MRIIVMSDSHGSRDAVEKIISNNPEADIFIHLGDGSGEVYTVKIQYPDLDIRNVRGNCDFDLESASYIILEAAGKRIFCTHGHKYGVRSGTGLLRTVAKDNGCCAALFGHTHERHISCEDGIDIMNPGSCSMPRDGNKPSYGIIDINDAGLFMNIFDVGI